MAETGERAIQPGDTVRVRDAVGRWHPGYTALSDVRIDVANAISSKGRKVLWESVRVSAPGGEPQGINWPATDVELEEELNRG